MYMLCICISGPCPIKDYLNLSILYQWYNGTRWTLENVYPGWYFKQSILYQWYNGTGWTLWNESIQDCTLRIIPTCPSCTNGTIVRDGYLRMSIQDGTLKIISTCLSCTNGTVVQDEHFRMSLSKMVL